ncbi:hypothetical protein DW2_13705 [Thioclava atlantica]|uniref:Uncharacterized protein n=1 Tax=Thioclava atlantica TaxID=1317124 RepID=A0A085TUE2_9RHOB|nr:hypothetical protein DW2_13705 [Thioclava atlantica]
MVGRRQARRSHNCSIATTKFSQPTSEFLPAWHQCALQRRPALCCVAIRQPAAESLEPTLKLSVQHESVCRRVGNGDGETVASRIAQRSPSIASFGPDQEPCQTGAVINPIGIEGQFEAVCVVVAHLGMEPVWPTRCHRPMPKGGFGENDCARFVLDLNSHCIDRLSEFQLESDRVASGQEVDCLGGQCRDQFE